MKSTGIIFAASSQSARTISIRPVEFLKGVSKALIKVAAGSYADAMSEVPEIVAATGLSASPQERVGTLIVRALAVALTSLVADLIKDNDEVTPDIHAASFSGITAGFELEVKQDFFDNPTGTTLVAQLRPDAERWMAAIGVSAVDIKNILDRLPSVFSRALHEEWRRNSQYYAEILVAVESPFRGAALLEEDWARYRSALLAAADERVFEETFGLRQVYVPPRCYFVDKQAASRTKEKFQEVTLTSDTPRRVLNWLNKEIRSWLAAADREISIRIIAGGPGSGKSSFAKLLAADLAEDGQRVLFVPLHQLDLESGITRSVADYFKETGHFSVDPLGTDGPAPLVLILDGLDEIQMQGRAAQEAAQNFVAELVRYIDRKNTIACNILCLITGRDLAVQSAEGLLRLPGQVLHLIPYEIPEEERSLYRGEVPLVDIDQRDGWWQKYGTLIGNEYEGIPDKLRSGELNEVTSQPLLNYLVALAYRRGVQIDETTNINSVYEDLLKGVYARGWARHSHPAIKDVPYDSFVRLLEEVALSVWHGAGRTTTLSEVEAHCQQSKVGALLPAFESGVSSGVSSLLLAFYFRQKGRREGGDKTFEFTHKTFAEYLIALRIVRLVDLITSEMAVHASNRDKGLDAQDALHKWLIICGKTPIDTYLVDFLRRELAIRGAEQCGNYQKYLSLLLTEAIRTNWPVQRIERLSFTEQQSYIRNAEETLLACLNGCARVAAQISVIDWPTETAAGSMIKRLQGQRKGPQNLPVMACLSNLDFSDQCLDIADLFRADLRDCRFDGAALNYAVLMDANLSRSTFRRARLEGANIREADLAGAVLQRSQLALLNRSALSLRRNSKRREELADDTYTVEILQKLGAIVLDDDGVPIAGSRASNARRRRRGGK